MEAYWCVSVRIGAYRCVWIRIGGYQCVPVRIVTYRCESVRIGLYWCLSLCIVVYRCTPVRYRCCVSVRMDSYRWLSVRMGYSRCVTYGRIEGIGVSLRTRTYRCRIQLCMVSLLRIGLYGPVSVGTSPYWLQSVCNGTYRCVSVRMYWCVSNCGVSVYQCVLWCIGVSVHSRTYRCVSRSVSVFRSLWRRCVTVSIGAYQCVCIGAYPTVVYPHTIGCMDLYWAYRRIGRIGCIVVYESALSGVSGVSVRTRAYRCVSGVSVRTRAYGLRVNQGVHGCVSCVPGIQRPTGVWMCIGLQMEHPPFSGTKKYQIFWGVLFTPFLEVMCSQRLRTPQFTHTAATTLVP
jgi:hypothetical protein